jgi:hypothetical protein
MKPQTAEQVNLPQTGKTEVVETQALQRHEAQPIDAVDILRAAVAGGITTENVAVVERMAALVERQQARQAELDYGTALLALQDECENVIAVKDVDGKFRYAPFLDIWNAVKPSVKRHKFTLQWGQEHHGDKVKVILTLRHLSGHKEDFPLEMRIGSNAPGTPAGSQAPVLDSITESRAKRRCLMNALNVVVDAVSSAEDVGDGTMASDQETDGLFKRLVALGGDRASQNRFLALAGVEAWDKIPKVILPILERLMVEKERAAARKATQ